MDKKELQNPALYTNRELSWLLFNKRVLSEARDKQLLLFERLKFLSITASNLDEFFHGADRLPCGYDPCRIYQKGHRRNVCKKSSWTR